MKTRFFLLLLLLSYNSHANIKEKRHPYNFILRGHVIGKHTHSLHMRYIDGYGKTLDQKVYIKNGSFVIKGYISSPVCAGILNDIKINPNNHEDISNYVDVFLCPGAMTISLKENDFYHAKITGSIMQKESIDFYEQRQPILKSKDSLDFLMNKLRRLINTEEVHKAYLVLLNQSDKLDIKDDLFEYNFIKTHPDSYFSAYLLDNCFDPGDGISLDSAESYYNRFTPAVKSSVAGLSVWKKITYKKASAPGSIAPLFTAIDIHGRMLGLKSFRHKNYVLLQFWASWCQCNDNRHLKKLYNTYRTNELEIIAISTDFRDSGWIDTIKRQSIGMWHHISEYIGTSQHITLQYLYNINNMPPATLFLIDKEGKILGRYYGSIKQDYEKNIDEGNLDSLDKKLAEVFPANK